jgi:allophanate hydrolase
MPWQELDISIAGLRQHYQRGDFTPRELVTQLLSLERADDHNIWIERLQPTQLEPYLQALENSAAPDLPLYGIPFAIKDNIDLAGVDTTAGCEAFRYRPEDHATVVGRLIAAGAIPMGKTNLDQFATGLVGARSPWGAGRNALNPEYISGGSSSGSAVATAKGLVSFALGTDTAGSGRVPAAFNNLVGVKPSRGLLSNYGLVPACRSLDCITIFSLTVDDAETVLAVAEAYDERDPYSRRNTFDNGPRRFGCADGGGTLGVPASEQLEFYRDEYSPALFSKALQRFEQMGHTLVEVDIAPLLEAAQLLYQGPWVAERYAAIEALITANPQALLPVIRDIIGAGAGPSAVDAFRAQYQLQAYRQQTAQLLAGVDCLVLPTAPTCYTVEQVNADPVALNSRLGIYTNFMNLLDLAAVAIPAGLLPTGVGFGITLAAAAFSDRRLLTLANAFCQDQALSPGALAMPLPASRAVPGSFGEQVELAVCGAHLDGMPLNWQLRERAATLVAVTRTSANYQLFAMQDGRPALIRRQAEGAAIEVEVWRLARSEFGSFVADIPAPLGIGKVELADGSWCCGFIAEPRAAENASDITALGGWRAYCAATSFH